MNQLIKIGNPLLRQVSQPISDHEFGTAILKKLEQSLFEMMRKEQGIGFAAPQMGIHKRAIVFGADSHPTRKNFIPIPYTVLFNPSFEPLSEIMVADYEGCLSVGALRGKVNRYQKIFYRGYDEQGHYIERIATDLHARVVQHEIDHLDGIIFLDKISDFHSLGFHEELIRASVL